AAPIVGLDLRPPMKDLRVLARQRMQPEGVADLVQLVRTRLEQSQPHEAALGDPGDGLLPRHRALIGPVAVLVVSTINDHPGPPLKQRTDIHPKHDGTYTPGRDFGSGALRGAVPVATRRAAAY